MCHLHDDVQRKKSIANQELAMINRDTFFFSNPVENCVVYPILFIAFISFYLFIFYLFDASGGEFENSIRSRIVSRARPGNFQLHNKQKIIKEKRRRDF